jgi:ABC-type antimicrobial peptide transport system permease subunit
MLRLGLFASLIGILGLLFLTLTKSHSILCIAFFFVIFNSGVSPVFSNAETKAIDVKEYKRGAASAFLASIEQCMAGTSTFIVSFFAPLDIHFSVLLMFFMIVISFYLAQKLHKRKTLSLARAEQESIKVEELKVAI